MAEEKIDATTWQRLLPWTTLFRAFQVTLDVNKLLLAVAGILVTWLSWWLLGMIFTASESSSPPDWSAGTYQAEFDNANDAEAWKKFRKAREHWNLMHEAAGLYRGSSPPLWELADIAETEREYKDFEKVLKDRPPGPETIKAYLAEIDRREATGSLTFAEARRYRARASRYALIGQPKPAGRLVVNPWAEDRGPNPYLLVTGQAGIPWEASNFGDWFARDQLPVMIEPLVKLLRPVIYFLSPRNTALTRLYFFLVVVATVLTWSFFGGAITRIAAVQIARGERIGLFEAVRFTLKRIVSYVTAPMFPIVVVAGLLIILMIFGLFGAIPWLGDVLIDGFLWFIPMLFGLIMAMALVGLVGWPLMAATISTEGTDSWEAVTRAYGYVYQRPWQYAWYGLVSLVYGGLVIFFVGFMGSLTVYLAKWGVSPTPFVQTPNHLFVYAPTSFGWRELLLEGAVVPNTDPEQKEFHGREVVAGRVGSPLTTGTVGGVSRWTRIDPEAYRAYVGSLTAFNKLGAALVAFWLGLAFLLVLSVGYVFFWTASTIIYLLLRKSLESAELDEVYMEEEDYEATFRAPTPAAPAPTPAPAPAAPKAASLPMVEPPASPTPAPLTLPTPPPEPPKLPPAKDEDKGGKPPVV
ncbi:MAG: hypothetical protein U0797_22525 [Gemmataceae bacterium]